jgi:hypothetical protein
VDIPDALEVLAKLAAEVAEVDRIVVFGSRVRGDNRPDSDLDIALWTGAEASNLFGQGPWERLHETGFASRRAAFPFPLHITINPEIGGETDNYLRKGIFMPTLKAGKVECLRTEPKDPNQVIHYAPTGRVPPAAEMPEDWLNDTEPLFRELGFDR